MNRITKLVSLLLFISVIVNSYACADTINIPIDYLTIQAGIDASADGDTVLVAPGTYYENLELTGKNITLASHYITTLDTMYVHNTIIDGNETGAVITIQNENEPTSPSIFGFTIQNGKDYNYLNPSGSYGSGLLCTRTNPRLEHLVIRDNEVRPYGGGGGCNFVYSNPVLKHVIITNNDGNMEGGGILCNESTLYLSDSIISDNHATNGGGIRIMNCESVRCENVVFSNNSSEGIYCDYSTVELKKVAIYNNGGRSIYSGYSDVRVISSTLSNYLQVSNTIVSYCSNFLIVNSIIWSLSSTQIISNTSQETPKNILIITSSTVKGGKSGIKWDNSDENINADFYYFESNISDDPNFINPFNGDFRLKEDSPCIDAGAIYFEWDGEVVIDMAYNEYSGSAPDIGAFEYDSNVFVEDDSVIPSSLCLYPPYPNPFNPITVITYYIPEPSYITVSFYNINGQIVEKIVSRSQLAGKYSVTWDATGYASGVYFARIVSGNKHDTKKMLLMK